MNSKYFFVSMICSLLVLILIVGFSIVERNAGAIILGQAPVFLSYNQPNSQTKQLKLHFMGKDFVFNFQ